MTIEIIVRRRLARKTKAALAVYNINPVVTLIGADERIEKFRHPIPTQNKWKKVLLIAVCAKREGLIANLSRVVCIGKIHDELQRKTEATAYVSPNFYQKQNRARAARSFTKSRLTHTLKKILPMK